LHGHKWESIAEEDDDAVEPENHGRQQGVEEQLASLAREVGAGVEIEVVEDDDWKDKPIKDDEDEYTRVLWYLDVCPARQRVEVRFPPTMQWWHFLF
jgi:hypothetical protein